MSINYASLSKPMSAPFKGMVVYLIVFYFETFEFGDKLPAEQHT